MENSSISNQIQSDAVKFSFLAFGEIPDIGLYLEQTYQFINQSSAPSFELYLTNSMISNYIKKGIIEKPIKKRHSRQQIVRLIFIVSAKPIPPLDNLKVATKMQGNSYNIDVAYQYLREESINCLEYVYQLKIQLDNIGKTQTTEKEILYNIILVVVHETYLNSYSSVAKQSTRLFS